ncbi:MAG: bifunctional riboflavin kinase/FAD synthetase [Pseudomonadota bacterium]
MKRVPGNEAIGKRLRGGVIALGNFDGFHLGHQAVVGRAVALARERGVPALVATFDPHPVRFFRPETPPFRLTTLDQREALFADAGADAMVVFHFDGTLAGLTAEQFVAERLVANLGVSGVVTGKDFTFGKAKGGNVAVLTALGAQQGFTVETVGPVRHDGAPVSSSRIRDLLVEGKPRAAAELLTRSFAIRGVVQPGAQVGRTLGYPTANVALGPYLRPRYGIYAVTAKLADGRVLQGAANLGVRPSFEPPLELLEPYFFDFDEDLYGQTIEVALVEFLRPEAKFADMDKLTAQMAKDCERARAVLASTPRSP